MTAKILCPTDGSDHATVGVLQAAEVAKATGGHLTICVVNIAHGGARGPTISHWKAEDVQKLMADADALAKS
ncbi:MAG: universal stress protein [Tabrizicola sp.]|uniref:universal stress protein n=1 Tax=Tabrizicola sp. TaxID=2005166 RepID=UPI002ABC9F6F|nr:universal stress protein [Tabrizicola sp.]MDZ4087996.1 universal stress protein [Tabrizicola sp.]